MLEPVPKTAGQRATTAALWAGGICGLLSTLSLNSPSLGRHAFYFVSGLVIWGVIAYVAVRVWYAIRPPK